MDAKDKEIQRLAGMTDALINLLKGKQKREKELERELEQSQDYPDW